MKRIIFAILSLTIGAIVTGIPVSGAFAASVGFSSATATFYQPEFTGWFPFQMIDGIFTGAGGDNGWAIYRYSNGYGSPGTTSSETALFTIASPLAAGQYNLTFTIYQDYRGGDGHLLGDFALGYTTEAPPTLSSSRTPISIQSASSKNGTTFSLLSPGELLTHNPAATDTFTILASIDSASAITGIFLNVFKNPALPSDGPGQFSNGNFVVTEFTLDVQIQTPLPGALPLFATGFGLLGLLGWRRKRKGRNRSVAIYANT